jgi:hypothetical protein
MSGPGLVIIASAVVLLIAVVLVAWWLQLRRPRAMRAFATRHGLSYMGDTWVLGDCDFSLFRKGEKRSWSNVMTGQWNGVTVVYADYSFSDRDGRSSQTYVFSAVLTDLGCAMPEVEVTARSMVGDLADSLSAQGLRLGPKEFDQRFVVNSDDESFAYELLDGRMIDVLLQCPADLHVHFGPAPGTR